MSNIMYLRKFEGLGGPHAWKSGIAAFPAFNNYVFSSAEFCDAIERWVKKPDKVLILHGDYGTGKSELASRLPVYMEKDFQYGFSYHRFNCADSDFCPKKSIDNRVRSSSIGGTSYFHLDEADYMKKQHQVILRQIIDTMPDVLNIVMTTNDVNKIDPGILTRSKILEVKFPDEDLLVDFVRKQLPSHQRYKKSDGQIINAIRSVKCKNFRHLSDVIELIS